MILDGHTHVFPEEVCRRRRIISPMNGLPDAVRVPQIQAGDPPEMVGAWRRRVDAAVVMVFPGAGRPSGAASTR